MKKSFVHIDKVSKPVNLDISKNPPGSVQWDFLINLPGAKEAILKKTEKGPDTVFIYLSLRCDKKCKECIKKDFCKGELDYKYEDVLLTLERLKKIGTDYIVYDGNSLSNNDFFKILEKTKNLGFQISLNVNRELKVEEIRKLKQNGVQKIQMKLYDFKNDNQKHQVNTDFLEKNLKLCKEHDLYTSLIFSLDNNNYMKLEKYIAFCETHSVGQFSFTRLPVCPFWDHKNWSFLNNKNLLKLSQKTAKYRKRSKTHVTSNEPMWKGCGAGMVSCVLLPTNLMGPCVYMKHFSKLDSPDKIINEWKSPLYASLRNSSKLQGKCSICKYNFYCKGCRAIAGMTKGSLNAEDEGCWI